MVLTPKQTRTLAEATRLLRELPICRFCNGIHPSPDEAGLILDAMAIRQEQGRTIVDFDDLKEAFTDGDKN